MDIYSPAEDSYLLQKYVKEYAFGRVLDMGTGSGIQALTAAEKKEVREVLAVDINETAIIALQKKIKLSLQKKIKVKASDLFSQVSGTFDTIIFNPPYLPQDKGIIDASIYGGRKGWELSARFFQEVAMHLAPHGIILFLFSSLTNKQKIDEMMGQQLLDYQQLGTQKLAFEELSVYLIKKSPVLNELAKKKVTHISYFTHGHRGTVFTGLFRKKKVIIKIKRKESAAVGRIVNEVHWLKKLNKRKIGPRLIISGKEYLVEEFVAGDFILDFIQKNKKEKIKNVLKKALWQCFVLDTFQVNKEELHRPVKHILITTKQNVFFLDFERCYPTKAPHNVTQFVDFICRTKAQLAEKNLAVDAAALRNFAGQYKHQPDAAHFRKLLALLQ